MSNRKTPAIARDNPLQSQFAKQRERGFGVRAADLLALFGLAVVALAALLLFGASLFFSAQLVALESSEGMRVSLAEQNALVSLSAFVAGFLLLRQIRRLSITRRTNIVLGGAVILLITAFGALICVSLRAEPIYDAGVMYDIVRNLRFGDPSSVNLLETGNMYRYYLVSYPFQLGYLSYLDAALAVIGRGQFLGALRLADVLLIASAYAGLMFITQELFADDHVTFVAILLLALCIPPVLYCASIYSQIPSFAVSVWGVYAVCRFLKKRSVWSAVVATICFALSVYLKPNAWIVILASGIALFLNSIRTKNWRPFALVFLIVLCAQPLPKLAQRYYEREIGTEFGAGYPLISWIAMSMQEGDQTPGWYDRDYNLEMKAAYAEDMDALAARSRSDIASGLERFEKDPTKALAYYGEKFATQWLEPTFMSVWSVRGTADAESISKNVFAQWVLGDSFSERLSVGLRYYLILLYGGFLLCCAALLKKRTEAQMILPLIILGGVLYHLIFEAQSRYALSYLPLLAPLAAYGFLYFWPIKNKRSLVAPSETAEPEKGGHNGNE